ncbi:site-specific integrase [Psychrobacter sp. KFRI-CH2-11]|uniref:site-specific integrase n=1 Tax=Psychrobacter sp. KFRI-CH2-11 TaxID=3156079 RepID=UPI0032501215
MLPIIINSVELPNIISKLAKFDGRKKRYVAYSDVLAQSSEARNYEIELLANLQTKWEQLRQDYPSDLSKVKRTHKYCRKACAYHTQTFLPVVNTISATHNLNIDRRWLRWDLLIAAFYTALNEQVTPINSAGFAVFQDFIHDHISKNNHTKKQIKRDYKTANRFIDYQNRHFMLADFIYPNITVSFPSKYNLLAIDKGWVARGKQINALVRAAQVLWQNTTSYSENEVLGWLIFSGVIYGGINNKSMLEGWFKALLAGQYQPFINQRLLVSPRFAQKRYGNERDADSHQLYNTQQSVVDLVTQCWIIRYQKEYENTRKNDLQSAEYYLMRVLAMIAVPLDLHVPTFTQFLFYASYHWEQMDDVNIDQALVTVLCGRQDTAGLTKKSFEQFLSPTYHDTDYVYDLDDILQLSIRTLEPMMQNDAQSRHNKKVRHSDLITDITKDFKLAEKLKNKRLKLPPPALIERVEKRRQQYTATNARVLLDWIMDFLTNDSSKAPKHSSVLQYVKSIGYEWLYFTQGQNLESFDAEDFEMLYEDILEYKSIARHHSDVSYYAKLFQRLHNFARDHYNFAHAIIPYEKGGHRVRAELVSPPIYHALIKQVLTSVDILEREMFALMFILVYRTGMRKKELLGLRFIDIEGLDTLMPSIVVRSNSYRGLKTASSNRRIPIFALLQPDELAFFIRYAQSSIGINPNHFMFSLSSSKNPVDDHVPLQLLKRLLNDISIDDNQLSHTFHAFRHTAVSNLALLLCGDTELTCALTDYNEQDILRIKTSVLGEHIHAQDRWYALSGIMGHLSPQRSFEYYHHFAVLMATYALSIADIKLSTQIINNITGFANKQLKQNHAIIQNDKVSLPSIRVLLLRNIVKHKRASPKFFTDLSTPLIASAVSSNSLFMRYGINRVWALLRHIDKNESVKNAALLTHIDIYDATIIVDRARTVAKIISIRGQGRFTKSEDISPISIQYQSDFRLLSSLQNSALILRDTSIDDWQWFIRTSQQRLSGSRAFVSFPYKEAQMLRRFIDIATQLLPAKNWLMAGHDEEQSKVAGIADDKIRRIHKADISTIHIGIATPDNRESQRNKSAWKFSPLLRFFVHMMLITDDALAIDNDQSLTESV